MAFQECVDKTKFNQSIKLSIDSSFINNKYGIEDIALNIDNKKKRVSKISVISDKNKFIYSILSIKINEKEIEKIDRRKKENKNKKNKKKREGFIHDVNTIQDSLDKINKIYNFNKITLMADKGYISTNDYYYNNNQIILLTYKKRNQIQNEEEIQNKLKERIYVENTISNLKKNERIMTRKDHKIKSYMGFVYLASLINNIKKINKNNTF